MDLQEIRNDPLNIDRDSLIDRLARIRGGGRGIGGNGGGGCVRRRNDWAFLSTSDFQSDGPVAVVVMRVISVEAIVISDTARSQVDDVVPARTHDGRRIRMADGRGRGQRRHRWLIALGPVV